MPRFTLLLFLVSLAAMPLRSFAADTGFYLHGDGIKVDKLFLDTNAPVRTNARTAIAYGVAQKRYVKLAAWTGDHAGEPLSFATVTDLRLWISTQNRTVRNGTASIDFDFLAELSRNGTPVATGGMTNRSITVGPGGLTEVIIPFGSPTDTQFNEGDTITLSLLVRVSSDLPADKSLTWADNVTAHFDSIIYPAQFGLTPPVVVVTGPEVFVSTNATASGSITATGRFPGAATVEIVGGAGIISIGASNGVFEATIPLQTNRPNRLFFTGIMADGTRSAPISIPVTQDSEPPSLFIDLPVPNALFITETVDVAGRVGDMLTGFMGLQVMVNGLPANVAVGIGNNGSFDRMSVPLELGTNTITATATDKLGNTTTREVKIRRVQPVGPRMTAISGNAQSASIYRRLAQPVAVQVTEPNGQPFANKLVSFEAIRSDGRLWADPEDTAAGKMKVQVRTDSFGYAFAWWAMGGDAGCGNNRLAVTSRDIEGAVYFCASANPGPPAQINIGSGNNQRAEVNNLAPEALRAWVSDACNGIAGVSVTFVVMEGGGTVNGAGACVVETGRTGHAQVDFALGPNPGRNVVLADFEGNPGIPARFVVRGVSRNSSTETTFSGLILDNASKPIGGALCRLFYSTPEGRVPLLSTSSDEQGQFTFTNPPPGAADLNVLGSFARTLAGQAIPVGTFPGLSYTVTIVPNAENSLPTPVLLPRLNTNNARLYRGTNDLVLTCEGMAGLKMTIKANSMRDPQGNRVTPDRPITVSLNQVHHDDVPMPMPDGAAPPFAWTLQPGGATFDPPIQIEYPNMSALPPGAIAYFLSFNHDTERFEIISSGHVIQDGSLIVTDPGAGLTLAGWGCNCPPYSVTQECKKCCD